MKKSKITKETVKWWVLIFFITLLIASISVMIFHLKNQMKMVNLDSGERIHIVNTFSGEQMMEIVGHVEIKKDIDTNSIYIYMENGSKVIMVEEKEK